MNAILTILRSSEFWAGLFGVVVVFLSPPYNVFDAATRRAMVGAVIVYVFSRLAGKAAKATIPASAGKP